jgi:hypothetical protein
MKFTKILGILLVALFVISLGATAIDGGHSSSGGHQTTITSSAVGSATGTVSQKVANTGTTGTTGGYSSSSGTIINYASSATTSNIANAGVAGGTANAKSGGTIAVTGTLEAKGIPVGAGQTPDVLVSQTASENSESAAAVTIT